MLGEHVEPLGTWGFCAARGLVGLFPSARERLANDAIRQPTIEWEQRYRRAVITSDTVATAFVVAAIGNFFGARDAANWHEKWGFSPSAPNCWCWGRLR